MSFTGHSHWSHGNHKPCWIHCFFLDSLLQTQITNHTIDLDMYNRITEQRMEEEDKHLAGWVSRDWCRSEGCVWGLASFLRPVRRCAVGLLGHRRKLVWQPEGACLATGGLPQQACLWPLAGGPSRWLFRGPGHRQEGVRAVAADYGVGAQGPAAWGRRR
jgi:hypothetical protein